MSKNDRMEQIRKARSLNDLVDVIGAISKRSVTLAKTAKNLASKTPVRRMAATAATETITLSPTRGARKIKIDPSKSKVKFTDKIPNFKAPNHVAVDKNVKVIQELYDNARELQAIESMLRHHFSKMKSQKGALAQLAKLRAEVDATVHSALDTLNRFSDKHFPKPLEDLRDGLTSFLLGALSEQDYDDMAYQEYVSVNNAKDTVFSVYIEIENLKNSTGYVFDEYYIILTGVVNKRGEIAYFVNALPDFRVPGGYQLGDQVNTGSELTRIVSDMLTHNDILTKFDRAPMPIADNAKRLSKFSTISGVRSAKVADDKLMLEIPARATTKERNTIIKEASAMLNRAIGGSRGRDRNISWKMEKSGSKTYLSFILYFKPGTQPKALNIDKLNMLAHALDLDDVQIDKLKRALLD